MPLLKVVFVLNDQILCFIDVNFSYFKYLFLQYDVNIITFFTFKIVAFNVFTTKVNVFK